MDKSIISNYVKCFFVEYLQNTDEDSPSVDMRKFINSVVESPECRLDFVNVLVELDVGSKQAEDVWLRGCDDIKYLAICSAMVKKFSHKSYEVALDEFRTYISNSMFI